jgi:hypothetical protein
MNDIKIRRENYTKVGFSCNDENEKTHKIGMN